LANAFQAHLPKNLQMKILLPAGLSRPFGLRGRGCVSEKTEARTMDWAEWRNPSLSIALRWEGFRHSALLAAEQFALPGEKSGRMRL
jgi:hypothetical protein